MRRPQFIARQSGRPTGLVGRIIARIMSKETAELNAIAVDALSLDPTDRVLEIGFGHGRTIGEIADRVTEGFVAGIDPSATMVRVATRRNRNAISEGLVALDLGSSDALPFDDASFDKALAVHTIYFWDDAGAHLREIRRVLRDGACFVLGFTPKGCPHAENFPDSVYQFYTADEIAALLAGSGFEVGALTEDDSGKYVALATAS